MTSKTPRRARKAVPPQDLPAVEPPAPPRLTLPQFLALAYQARHGSAPAEAAARLKAALEADPALKGEAQAYLATITEEVCQRCHIQKIHREALREVLNAA